MTHSTRVSLLTEAGTGSGAAWTRLVELYQPLVFGWLRRHQVDHHDAEELTQEVLSVVVKELPDFDHTGRRGAFRTWLRRITANRASGYWRAGRLRPRATGNSRFQEMVAQLEDENSDLSRIWNEEHDNHVLRQLLRELETQVEAKTLQAFRRLVFDHRSAQEVAAELDLKVAAVYCAKSRVMRILRRESERFLDETTLSR